LFYSLILCITLSSGMGAIDSYHESEQLVYEVTRDSMLAIVNQLEGDIERENASFAGMIMQTKSGGCQPESVEIDRMIVSQFCYVNIKNPRSVAPVVYDAAGQKVKELEPVSATSTPQRILLDATDIPTGIYWLGIPGSKGVVSRRFVVVR
jgi:hypothetical protein